MRASPDTQPRRRRYARAPVAEAVSLTPAKLTLLRYVADYRLASLPQLAALACPAESAALSQRSARRHLRALFDHGLVEVVPVSRINLADPTTNDVSLLYGSAPNVYTLTRAGAKALHDLGYPGETRTPDRYGPRNSLFMAHELAIRDARVWLELTARASSGHQVEVWQDGAAAEIDLQRQQLPKRVRPDGWFIYRLGPKVLVGFLEMDRGTERGGVRWQEKLTSYQALFEGDRLRVVTGYQNARVLVVAPDAQRRDHLAAFIQDKADRWLASRFWLAERSVLEQPSLTLPGWVQPGDLHKRALIPPELVSGF